MKQNLAVIFLILSVSLLLVQPTFAKGNGKWKNTNTTPALTNQEELDLLQLREEEKLARDVYLYLYDKWGQWIFANIAESEQRHMGSVLNLLVSHNIPDPVGKDIPGVFQDKLMQNLYDDLITEGSVSKVDALRVGAKIEDMDIFDIYEMLTHTEKNDLINVYENLAKGSRNHLRAFVGQLEMFGESYKAQGYLTQEEIDAIVDSPRETGRY